MLGLATVSLIALLILGVAVNQILNSYFEEQEGRRLDQAADGIARFFPLFLDQASDAELGAREIREGVLIPQIAQLFADQVPATLSVSNPDGSVFAWASPRDEDGLRETGLAADDLVAEQHRWFEVVLPAVEPDLTDANARLRLTVVLSEPYTSRQQTLDSVRGALVGAGALALLVSVLVGAAVARSVTRPIAGLRRASATLAQGDLDERVPPSGVVELDQLGQQFNVMADRLRESLTLLSEDRDRLRQFVADVSHELRTPIAALRAFTELQQDGEMDAATRREFIERSAEQIARLEWLSTNLLDLSRIEAGIFPLDVRAGDLRDPVRSAVEAHASVAEAREVSLSAEVPAVQVALPFDRERILQLVTNLVGNALKFTPPGGAVELRLRDRLDAAVVEVRDTGPGILPAELPHIFDRFYRGTNTGEARGVGSGLGLAIAKSIVDMHGGEIQVESRVGVGTLFRVVLPRPAQTPRPVSLPRGEGDAAIRARRLQSVGEDQ